MRLIFVFLFAMFLAVPASALESAPVRSARAVATLVSDHDSVAPGESLRVGLRLRIAPGWHTYWKNPGDAGVPPQLLFSLPPGVSAGPIAWPAPARHPEANLMTYGYDGELLLPVTLSGGGRVALHATWLVCANICVPEEGDFALDVPVGASLPAPEAGLFTAAAARVPVAAPWPAEVAPDGTLTLRGEGISPASVADAWFASDDLDVILPAVAQRLRVREGLLSLALKPGEKFAPGAGMSGVLVLQDGSGQARALQVSAVPGAAVPEIALLEVLGLAFLGGLILNLMPCVFPVLAMKAVSVAALGGKARGHASGPAAAYTAGVVASFDAVAFLLLALRAGGAEVGWGFQFQSPGFVAVMAGVLFAVGLNLSGVFALGGPIGAGQALAARGGWVGSFFTGFLAVLVATPCTAPFMGVAITAGLAGSAGMTLAVFTALGLGLAAPYVLLSTVPAVARALPRPGQWMVVLRQALAFPMYGAAAWLTWVLAQEAGPDGVLAASVGFLCIGVAGWMKGLADRDIAPRLGRAVALAALLAAGGVMAQVSTAPAAVAHDAGVEPFSAARLAVLRGAGKTVFVNMTAAWCVTCLINERVALSTSRVRDAFAERGVVYMKGDWTRQDPAISAFLNAQGRDGVPLYLVFAPGRDVPSVLPQVLTERTVLDAIGG